MGIRARRRTSTCSSAPPTPTRAVYRALAAFAAPHHTFEVTVDDFATYDGVLQIGLPPRRIDILNRADGVSFDEAIADGRTFEIEGRAIPIIGLSALLANKRAAGRAQDLADVRPRVAARARALTTRGGTAVREDREVAHPSAPERRSIVMHRRCRPPAAPPALAGEPDPRAVPAR